MKRRRYSDEERASAIVALSANGGNVEGTAKQLGIPPATLEHWAKGRRHPEARQLAEKKRKPLADCLEALARKLAQAMPAKMEGASLQQIAVSMGIAVDKMLLLRGQDGNGQDDSAQELALKGMLVRLEHYHERTR